MAKIALGTDTGTQLTMPVVSDQNSVANRSVSEHKHAAIQRFLDSGEKENDVGINTYSPGRRKAKYYRLSYRQEKKVKHIHIPGGNVHARLAQYRAKKLQEMIDRGAELEEIIAAVDTYRSGGN